MNTKEAIEKRLLAIRPAIREDGGDFEILEITDDGVVTLKIKGTKRNKPRTRETQRRLLDYVLRKDPDIVGYQKIVKVDWITSEKLTLMEKIINYFQ